MPVAPRYNTEDDSNSDSRTQADCVIRSLRYAVEKVPSDLLVKAASSAFHAEPLLLCLCEEFEKPVRTIAISEDGFVVIKLNIPKGQEAEVRFAMGPHGEGACWLKCVGFESNGLLRAADAIPLGVGRIENLVRVGLPRRLRTTSVPQQEDSLVGDEGLEPPASSV